MFVIIILCRIIYTNAFFAHHYNHHSHHTKISYRQQSTCLHSSSTSSILNNQEQLTNTVTSNIIAVIPKDSTSFFKIKPYKTSVSWMEVLQQVQTKLTWEDENVTLSIVNYEDFVEMPDEYQADIAMLIGVDHEKYTESSISKLGKQLRKYNAVAAFNCTDKIMQLQDYGNFYPSSISESFEEFIDENILKSNPRRKQRLAYRLATETWERKSSDDILFLMLILMDTFSTPISSVQKDMSVDNTGFSELQCMCGNCGQEMVNCFKNPICRQALDCLNKCRGNDQVCAYRCITSYETQDFENFARCILQRNNCMKNSAVIPAVPNPEPMTTFRGKPLTFDTALKIFEGHVAPRPNETSLLRDDSGIMIKAEDGNAIQQLEYLPQSWMVVCGQNPAYDYFSCQHQIFYKDANRSNVVWYDPVFKVVTLDGQEVWRRRHYRVRKAKIPGQFYFSVLDNGVMSNEFWRILDCADDLSWGVFYYAGAASAAGTNYRGALIVSRDGTWPTMTEEVFQRMSTALDRAGIKMWELFEVSNVNCYNSAAGPPPLGYE